MQQSTALNPFDELENSLIIPASLESQGIKLHDPELSMPMIDLTPHRDSEWCGGFIRWAVSDTSLIMDSKEFKRHLLENWLKIKNWLTSISPTQPCLYLQLTDGIFNEETEVRHIAQREIKFRDYRRQLIKIFQQLAVKDHIDLRWVLLSSGGSLIDAVTIPNLTPCIRFSEALLERPLVMESELIRRTCWWLDQPDSNATWMAWRRFQRRLLTANIQPNAVLINITDGSQIGRWFSIGVRRFSGIWSPSDAQASSEFISYHEPSEVAPF